MSTPTVQCPTCFTRVTDTADQTGDLVCPGCENEFTPARDAQPRPKPNLPVARAIPVPGKPGEVGKGADKPSEGRRATPLPTDRDRRPSGSRRDEDDDTGRPREKFRRRDDDDRPRSARKRWRDEDEDDEPKKKDSALPLILIAGGALLLLLLGGTVAVAVAVIGNQPVARATTPSTTPASPTGMKADNRVPGKGDWKEPDPFVEPKNPDPLPFEPDDPKGPKELKGLKVPPKYADVTPLPLKPAKLDNDTVEVKLPGKAGDTCSGGGGRFFIVHISDKRQLAVFDVNEAKVVKYIALASDAVKFAAGMNKLVVAYPDQGTFTRYDLTTFEKDVSVKSPVDGTVRHLCMGSASAGPLLVSYAKGGGALDSAPLTFLDPTTFKEVDVEQPQNRVGTASVRDAMHFRASPDGTLFGAWCTSHSPQGLNSIVMKGGSAKGFYEHDSVGHVVPGPDGTLYTGRGKYTGELKKLGKEQQNSAGNVLLPAAEGHLYLRLSSGGDGNAPFPGGMPGDGQKMKLEVKMIGDERTLHTFKDVSLTGNEAWTSNDFTNDKRVHFAPSANLLVTLSNAGDKLVLHRFDLEAAFEASGVDYLYVASRPPTAVPGKGYEYQIGVRSKKGGVKCKLDAGPVGLKVTEGGKVTWATPHDFKGPEQVIITVSDASGQEVFHTFELVPGDGKGFAGPIVGAPKAGGPKADDKPDPKAALGLVTTPDRVFEITPPQLQEKTAVSLPGPADGVCVGGGGRFLVLRLATKKQLAVLDLTFGKVVKYLPLAESDALFAAGMTKLFVYNKTAAALLRYDLEKFEKEVTAQNPLGGSPGLMLMGHSSDGPLYLGGTDVGTDTKGYGFINPRTMKELKVPLEGAGPNGQVVGGPAVGGDRFGGGGATGVAVSPDGRTYCWGDNWGGNRVMTLTDKVGKVKGDGVGGGQNRGAMVPGPDGHLFGGQGVYTSDLKKAGDAKQNPWGTFAPATSGGWYVSVVEGDRFDPARGKRKVAVRLTSDERVKFPLDSLDGLPAAAQDQWAPPERAKLPMASRLFLVPEAEILAVVDDGMEKVHLHRVPVKSLLEKSDGEYMMVVSRPPPAVRGQKWAYTPDVWSKKGGVKVKVKVESGPDGMTATGGTVSWDVPARPADDEPTVILTVSDASGQESFHTFALSVRGEGLPAVTLIKPVAPSAEPVKPADPNTPKPKAPAAFPLKPTAAKDGTDIDLPAAADAACLAGGGRFILFRIPSKKLVAVFDVVDGKVAKELAMPEEGALVAGGRSFAYVVNPKAGLVQRWNLSTFEKEATTKLPDGLTPSTAVMGHASEGPLYLGGGGRRHPAEKTSNGFYNPLTLTKLEYKSAEPDKPLGLPEESFTDTVHASSDGRVFAWWRRDTSPNGVYSFTIADGNVAHLRYAHSSAAAILVGADGSLFTACGVFAADFKTVHDSHPDGVKLGPPFGLQTGERPGQYGRPAVPAVDGPFYLWFPPTKKDNTDPGGPPAVKMLGVKESLGELAGVRGLEDPKENRPDAPAKANYLQPNPSVFPFYQRTFLIPAADVLAILSPDGTKVHIHSFKARDLLDKSGQEYLLVMGRPPQVATPGTKWAYTPDVWSKKGGVKVEVTSGPAGLKAVGTGVSWDVPKELLDNQVTVELKVSDASGKSLSHAFTLSLSDTAPTPADPRTGGVTTNPDGGGTKKGKVDDALVGTWALDKSDFGGGIDNPNSAELKNVRFVFEKDGTLNLKGGPAGNDSGTFQTDESAKPKSIDMTSTSGGGQKQLGVYEIDGDTLKICFAFTPGSARPTKLKAELGESSVLIFKRVKDGGKKDDPSGSVPPVKPDPPKGPVAPPPKGPGGTVTAAPFDDAWKEYVKRTGLAPATFKGETAEVELAGRPGPAVIGGGGRFLVLPVAQKKALQVIDLSTATVAFDLPFDPSTQAVAANLATLFVRDAKGKTLTRYDLTTGKGAKTVDMDLGSDPGVMVAAPASADAPLLVWGSAPKMALAAVDPDTLKELPGLLDPPGQVFGANGTLTLSADGTRLLVQLSADPGKRFYHLGTRTGDKFTWTPSTAKRPEWDRTTRPFRIAGTGTVSHWADVYSPDAKTNHRSKGEGFPALWASVGGGPLYGVLAPPGAGEPLKFALACGPDQPWRFLDLPVAVKADDPVLHVSEPLGVVAHFGEYSTKLTVRKFDLKKLLDDSKLNAPAITLAPPAAERGKTFTCTPAVWGKKNKVELTLADGPEGMTLTPAGKLEWAVPADFADPFAAVTLTATAGGEKSSLTVYPAVTGPKK